MKKWLLCVMLLLAQDARSELLSELTPAPFKGPLLTPSPYVPGNGHQQYELYFLWTERHKRFDSDWHAIHRRHRDNFQFYPLMKFGSSPLTEVDVVPHVFYNNSQGPHQWVFGDCDIAFCIQPITENKRENLGWPNVKLRVGATLPFGKYDRLNPAKYEADAGGAGTFNPNLSFRLGKYLHINPTHWVSLRASYTFFFGTSVDVEGDSIYGNAETIGHKVYLGNRWEAAFGFEATLVGHLALIGDLVANYRDSIHASQKKHLEPSAILLTAAPGLEYDFSEKIGVLFGPAISFAGRNRDREMSWVLSIKIHN